MADLVGGIPGATSLGGSSARIQNGAGQAGPQPVPVNQQQPPSGVRTPTDIMRQRREREGRRKAEQEARDREQEEAERRRQRPEPAQQPPVQQPYAAGVDRNSQRRPTTATTGGQRHARTGSIPGQPGPPPASAQPVPGSQQPGSAAKQPNAQHQPQQPQSPRRTSFPHAFERWETLSSHWEGLTGYWIRKLEQNNQDLERDPLSQQMARQVTDLSAAGANLFHAVVELQRLRASSERKFQRWFFDTRAEQEKHKELQAEMERQLRAERQGRAEAVASLQRADGDKRKAEDLVREMRRELQISKDESRRAWEELGRREQEERDRTASLRNGEPTLVGGVQVVPMISGLPNRQPEQPLPPQGDSYTAGDAGVKMPDTTQSPYYQDQPSPTGSDPFSEEPQPGRPSQDTYPGHFYRPESSVIHHGRGPSTSEPDDRSYTESDPGDTGAGEYYRHDSQGRPIVYPGTMSEESEDYEGSIEEGSLYVPEGGAGGSGGGYAPTTTTVANPSGAPVYANYPASGDYGWGWGSVTPRHRHPTRLSDVIEEEEPRTTPSRASRASHD